jgi:hypothetical protein
LSPAPAVASGSSVGGSSVAASVAVIASPADAASVAVIASPADAAVPALSASASHGANATAKPICTASSTRRSQLRGPR